MKKLKKERRFLFTEFAVGFNGLLKAPREERIESQAVSSLAVGGGVSTSRVENVRVGEFLSIKSLEASSVGRKVTVERKDGSRVRMALGSSSAILEGFNMLDVVRVGRISARVAADRPDNGEDPEITTIGSGFEDLSIAGRRVEIEYNDPLLCLLRFSDLKENFEALKLLSDSWLADRADRKEIDGTTVADVPRPLPKSGKLTRRDSGLVDAWMKLLRFAGPISCSIVKEVHGLPGGVEVEPYPRRHVLYVPGFGEVNLGEVIYTPNSRRLTMMRFDLGCTHGGCGCAGDVCDDGSWNP